MGERRTDGGDGDMRKLQEILQFARKPSERVLVGQRLDAGESLDSLWEELVPDEVRKKWKNPVTVVVDNSRRMHARRSRRSPATRGRNQV